MKKLLIAFSMIGAGALIACADGEDNSVKPNYTNHQWFAASVQNGAIVTTGGSFQSGSESTVEPTEDDKIGFDSDFENPVQFKLDENTSGKTTDLTRVVFELEASVVTESARPKPEDLTDAKLAFALCTVGSATNFCYCMGGGSGTWTSLDFTNIPKVDDLYTLIMRFDDSDSSAKKVRFSVALDDETLVWEDSDWLTYAGLASKPQIDFVGCGKVRQLKADQVWIVSSEVIIEGGKVTIADKDMGAMKALVLPGKTIEEVLTNGVKNVVTAGKAISVNCPLSVAEAYAVGLIANEGGTMVAKADGTFKVKADAQAKVDDGIPVGFVTPLTPNDTTATFSYQLQGLVDEETGYVNVGGSVSTPDAIKIPTDKVGASTDKDGKPTGKYRYFKVVTTVTLAK